MKKYDVGFCSCGRVDYVNYDELCEICDAVGQALLICKRTIV